MKCLCNKLVFLHWIGLKMPDTLEDSPVIGKYRNLFLLHRVQIHLKDVLLMLRASLTIMTFAEFATVKETVRFPSLLPATVLDHYDMFIRLASSNGSNHQTSVAVSSANSSSSCRARSSLSVSGKCWKCQVWKEGNYCALSHSML